MLDDKVISIHSYFAAVVGPGSDGFGGSECDFWLKKSSSTTR